MRGAVGTRTGSGSGSGDGPWVIELQAMMLRLLCSQVRRPGGSV